MDLYEAIQYKNSVRSFNMDPLEETCINNIMLYTKFVHYSHDTKAPNYEILTNKEIKQKFGVHLEIKAPYYIIVYVEKVQNALVNAGFLLGQLSIYLTMKEIGTNLIGLKNVSSLKDKNTTYQLAILAFGKTIHPMKKVQLKQGQLLLNKYCYLKEKEMSMYFTKQLISAASYAPIKVLYQPYRFLVYEDHIHIVGKKEGFFTRYQKDMMFFELGLLLAYMQVKAEELWISLSIREVKLESDSLKKNYIYLRTVFLKGQDSNEI